MPLWALALVKVALQDASYNVAFLFSVNIYYLLSGGQDDTERDGKVDGTAPD